MSLMVSTLFDADASGCSLFRVLDGRSSKQRIEVNGIPGDVYAPTLFYEDVPSRICPVRVKAELDLPVISLPHALN